MARKRKKLNHLDYNSRAYWEGVLRQENLPMSRGRHNKLVYVGGTEELVFIEKYQGQMNLKGQNKLGHGPDC